MLLFNWGGCNHIMMDNEWRYVIVKVFIGKVCLTVSAVLILLVDGHITIIIGINLLYAG